MITIKTKDNKELTINRENLIKLSNFAKVALSADSKAETLNVDVSAIHFNYIMEYIEHHAKKEAPAPVPPLAITWTLDTFEDKWDGALFKKIIDNENDSLLIEFSKAVEYMDMDLFLRKTALVIALNTIHETGLNSDKIAESFNRLALKKN